MLKLKSNFWLFIAICSLNIGNSQNSTNINELLTRAQTTFNTDTFYMTMNYKMFGDVSSKTILEEYESICIKNKSKAYFQVNNTISISDLSTNTALKIYKDEGLIEIHNSDSNQQQFPIDITNYTKLFKKKTVKETDTHFICSLQADIVSQIPYGRIDVYIKKETYLTTKQVVYFSSLMPYIDKNGEEKKGNPRLEISFFNFKKEIPSDYLKKINISNYISGSAANENLKGINEFKSFKITKI